VCLCASRPRPPVCRFVDSVAGKGSRGCMPSRRCHCMQARKARCQGGRRQRGPFPNPWPAGGKMHPPRGHSPGERGIAWEGSPHLGRGLALSVAVVSHGPEDLMSARGGALESYVKKSTGAGKEDLVQSSLEERVFTCPPPAVEGPRGFRDRALASCCSAWRAPGHRKGRRGVEA